MSQGKSGMCGPQSRPQHRQHPGSIPACSASPVPQFPHPCWKRLRAPGFILVILEGKQAECASQALSHALPGAGVTPSPAGSSGPAAGPSGCCCRRTPRPPRRPAGPAAALRSAAAAAAPSRARPGRPRTPAPPASARRLRGPEQGDIGTTRGVRAPPAPRLQRPPRSGGVPVTPAHPGTAPQPARPPCPPPPARSPGTPGYTPAPAPPPSWLPGTWPRWDGRGQGGQGEDIAVSLASSLHAWLLTW